MNFYGNKSFLITRCGLPFHVLKWTESRSVVSNSLRPHGLYSPWNSPDQNTGVGSLSLLQWIFPTQESNWSLLHCRQILYQLSYVSCLNGIFWWLKILNLIILIQIYQYFMHSMICVLFKNTYWDQSHEVNCLCFLLETWIFSLLSILYLWPISNWFGYGLGIWRKEGVKFFLFPFTEIQFTEHHLL